MSFFQQVEGEAAVLVVEGVYRQVDLYKRDGFLYAAYAGGFVRLMADGSTSKAKMRLDHMSWGGPLYKDALGRLVADHMPGVKTLEGTQSVLLLGRPE